MRFFLLKHIYTSLLFLALLSPTIDSVCALIVENHHNKFLSELFDSEKEENTEKGESESKDAKEKENLEDEKLKSRNSKYSLLYLENALRAQTAHTLEAYRDFVSSVLTPPPEYA